MNTISAFNRFLTLLKQNNEKGYVNEKVFEELGFPMDEDENCIKNFHDVDIAQESRQRAKILIHDYQTQLRTENKMGVEEGPCEAKSPCLLMITPNFA